MTGPIIYGGPLPYRLKFREYEVVFVNNLKKIGTIVSGELTPGIYGIQPAVLVEFQSGEGLPGNDRVQTVALSQLRKRFASLTDNEKFNLLYQEYVDDGAEESDAEDTALQMKESGQLDSTLREVFGYTDDTIID